MHYNSCASLTISACLVPPKPGFGRRRPPPHHQHQQPLYSRDMELYRTTLHHYSALSLSRNLRPYTTAIHSRLPSSTLYDMGRRTW